MDKASVSGAEDCGFESRLGFLLFQNLKYPKNKLSNSIGKSYLQILSDCESSSSDLTLMIGFNFNVGPKSPATPGGTAMPGSRSAREARKRTRAPAVA